MDRKSKIFTPTRSVGGIRKTVKETKVPATSNLMEIKKILDSMKTNIGRTQLTSCSYEHGSEIVNIDNPSIQSINKGGKNICLLVNGNPHAINKKETMKNLPEDLENLMEKFSETKENQDI